MVSVLYIRRLKTLASWLVSLAMLCQATGVSVNASRAGAPSASVTLTKAVDRFTPPSAIAQDNQIVTVFGPRRFTRKSGQSTNFTERFSLPPGVDVTFSMRVDNGAPDGTKRVTGALIRLNDVEIVSPQEFNETVAAVTRSGRLEQNNTLEIRLTGPKDSFITITITAFVNLPPPLAASLQSVEPTRAAQGETLQVILRGRNTHWVAGLTRASLGGEVSVGGAPAGEPGPVTVTGLTTALAQVTVSPTAALAPRNARVTTSLSVAGSTVSEVVTLADAFTVYAVTSPGSSATMVATLAGAAGSPGFADGTGTTAQFRTPTSLATGPDDTIYVADAGNHRIRVVREQPNATAPLVTTLAGDGTAGFVDGPANSARFNNPQGVAIMADGAVVVADTDNHRIRRIAPDGTVTTLAGDGTPGLRDGVGVQARFNAPRGIAVGSFGNIYVADTGNSVVRLLTSAGEVRTVAGDGTVGSNDAPNARFDGIAGVAVDGDSVYVYLADAGNHRIRRLDASGAVFTIAGAERGFADGTAGQSRFAEPSGIAVDGSGHLVVADTVNSLVRLISPALALGGNPSAVTTLAGTGERGLTDGPGNTARFFTPRGVAVGSSSAIYVADTGSHVLRRILLPPSINSISPSQGHASDETVINGARFDGLAPERNTVTFKRSGGGETVAHVNAATRTQLRVVVPQDAVTGPVSVETAGGKATSPTDFEVLPSNPTITNFTPSSGTVGTIVTVIGTNLRLDTGDTTVTFTGAGGTRVPASVLSLSPIELSTVVPDGAVTGPIEVTTQAGSAFSSTNFEVVSRAPIITDFTPKRGRVGATVRLIGTALKLNTIEPSVTFNGNDNVRVPAVVTFSSESEVRVTVPVGATTGPIELTTTAGSSLTAESFIVDVPQDFQITVAPSTAPAIQRGTATYGVYLTSEQATFTQMARLSVIGAPNGVGVTFEPSQITSGARSTLSLNLANADLAPGSYNFTIQAAAEVDGRELIRVSPATINVLPAGQTTLSGLVFSTDKEPILGATVSLDGRTATTDSAGAFLLINVTAGTDRPLMVDGRTASAPNRSYPIILEPANIIAGQANAVPYTFYLPPIDTQFEVDLVPGQNTVAANPRVPDLQMTVPAGANLRNRDGSPVARISITPLSIDRVPAPLPPNVSISLVYTSQPGGAIADIAMPVVYPNLGGDSPGTRMELYAFDHDNVRWYVYGFGRVSADGRTVVPEIDPTTGRSYGLRDFSWHAPSPPPPPQPPVAPNGNPGGNPNPNGPNHSSPPNSTNNGPDDPCQSNNDADNTSGPMTVDLSTGSKIEMATDILIAGQRGRLELSRVYTTDFADSRRTPITGRFGVGFKDGYDIRLTGTFDTGGAGRVVMPSELTGRLFSYERTDADGALVFTTTAATTQLGDVVRRLTDGTFEYRYADGRVMRFNSDRRLVSSTDRNGNAVTLTYTGANPTRITDPVGRTLTLEYNSTGRISRVTDPLDRNVTYAYDGNGRLASVTDAQGGVMRYAYDGFNRLASVTDRRGNLLKQITYDDAGRVAMQRFAEGGFERYTYTRSGQFITAATVTDSLGRIVVRRFNATGFVIEKTDALGQTSQRERDLRTNLTTSVRGPCGCTEATRQFDPRGNLLALTDRLNQTSHFEYEPVFNNVTKSTDKLGRVTTYSYDARGNLISMTDALNRTTTYTNNQFGQVTSITDPLGHTTRFEYDAHGNVSARSDALNNRTTFEYDVAGRLTSVTDPLNRRSSMTYDALDRMITRTDPSGAISRYAYDANGNQVKMTDALGRVWTNVYDERNRLISNTNPRGQATERRYNEDDELIELISPSGRATRFGYDARGQLLSITAAIADTVRFSYDNRGNLVNLTDERGNTTTFTYDELFRLTSRADPLGNVTSFTYDAAGNRVRTVDRLGRVIARSFDALNRPARIDYADADVTFTYDSAGRQTRIDDSQSGHIEWSYDDADRLLSETTPQGTVSYSYNAADQRLSMTAADRAPVAYGYDAAGRLQTITQGAEVFTYSYDQLSRPANLQRPNGVRTAYDYDEAGRLSRLLYQNALGQPVEDFNYAYNADGEIENISSLAAHRLMPVAKMAGPSDAANRLNQLGPLNFSFDLEGQTLTRAKESGAAQFDWDARGRLKGVTLPDGRTISYVYDALGRRTSRTAEGVTTNFLHDGDNVVLDRASDGAVIDYLNGIGIDEKLRQSSGGGALYFMNDHLRSTIALTDAAGGAVERLQYEAYGESANSQFTRYGFTGRERDAATGLIYYRARWYDPQQGRFLSEDPAGAEREAPNLYGYVQFNPINRSDPFGLWYVDINVSFGWWGVGITGGFLIGPNGLYRYAGGGIMTPGPGASLTWSPQNASNGWNQGAQVGYGAAFQYGWSYGTDACGRPIQTPFQEYGFGTPGASFTQYYVEQFFSWGKP